MGEFDDIFGNIGDTDGDDIGNIREDDIRTIREGVKEGQKIVKKRQEHVSKFILEHSTDNPIEGLSVMMDASLSFAMLNKFLDTLERTADKIENTPKKRAEQIERMQKQSEDEVDAFLDFLNSHPEIKDKGIEAVNNEAVKWFDKDKKEEE